MLNNCMKRLVWVFMLALLIVGCTADEKSRAAKSCVELDCASENRDCVPNSIGGAKCTESCLPGNRLEDDSDSTSACVPFLTCAEVEEDCDGVCVARENQDAECLLTPCEEGHAYSPDAPTKSQCIACDFEGLQGCTGKNLPFASSDGVCICETQPGYFWNPNAASEPATELCDKDGDGWVDERAAAIFSDPSTDPIVRQAASCDFRIIDRFVLKNDIPGNEDREVTVSELSGGQLATLILQESERNDDPSVLEDAYASGALAKLNGKSMPASALNALTKVCGDSESDFNDNGVRDLNEFQQGGAATTVSEIFARMSYFMMLADGHFEPPGAPGESGRYVITERTRGQDLALKYTDDSGDFRKACPRFPDAIHTDSGVSVKTGTDFAQYSTPPADHLIRNANSWQGMNHNSQFKCLNVVENEPLQDDEKGPHVVLKSVLENQQEYTLNNCTLADEQAAEGGKNPTKIAFDCSPAPVKVGVQWAAVNYISGPFSEPSHIGASDYAYQRGCVDMCEVWRASACQAGSNADIKDAGQCFADAADFGKQFCGCSLTYGGKDCDIGCPSLDHVMHSARLAENPASRTGKYWMCGGVSASHMESPFGKSESEPDSGYQIRGEISVGRLRDNGVIEKVCEPEQPGCKAYRVR